MVPSHPPGYYDPPDAPEDCPRCDKQLCDEEGIFTGPDGQGHDCDCLPCHDPERAAEASRQALDDYYWELYREGRI